MKLKFSGTGKFFSESFDGKEYQGNLYLNSNEGGIMLEIEVLHSGAPLSYLEVPLEIQYITGELTNGFKMTLLNCSRRATKSKYGWGDTYTYIAEFMIEGLKIPNYELDKFEQISFNIPESILWGNKSYYGIKEDYSLIEKLDEDKTILFEDGEIEIEYYVSGSMLPVHEMDLLKQEIKLKQISQIIIKSGNPKNFKFFLDKFRLIKRFIEIGMNRPLKVTKISALTTDQILEKNGFDLELPRSFTIEGWNRKNDKEYPQFSDRYSYIFNLDDVSENGNFRKYMENTDRLAPVVDLYLDLIYSKEMTVTQAFLNVTQALETFHSRFICSGGITQFKNRIENNILKEVPESNKEFHRKMLIANSSSFVTLQSRIADLLIADFQVHFYTGKIPFEEFPKKVVSTRNYYTHYDESKKDQVIAYEELNSYNSILKYILEYYLLKEIGFSDSEFRRKCVSEKMRDISIHFDLAQSRE